MGWQPDYVSVEELAEFVRVNDLADDNQLALAVTTSSRAVDRACNRQFGLVDAAEPRVYTAHWDRQRCRWVVKVDDIATLDGLVVAFDSAGDLSYATTVTPVRAHPVNALAEGRPYEALIVAPTAVARITHVEDAIRVTARWGWSEVPAAIQQATLLQASRLLSRRDSPYGVAGSAEAGSELRLLARLDVDVEVSIASYRRWWGAV